MRSTVPGRIGLALATAVLLAWSLAPVYWAVATSLTAPTDWTSVPR